MPRIAPIFVTVLLTAVSLPGPLTAQPTIDQKQTNADRLDDTLPPGALMRLGTSRFRHAGQIYSMAYSADGRYLVTGNAGHRTLNNDSSVILWDAQTGREIHHWKGHAHVVRSVAMSPDNKRVAVCNGFGKLVLYDVDSGKPWQLETDSVECACFGNDGRILFVADRKLVRRWDLTTGKELEALRGHTDRIFSIAVAAKGKLVATCATDGMVRLHEGQGADAPVHRHTFVIPKKYGLGLAFSPDGKRLACGTFESDIHLWDTANFKELWRVNTDAFRVSAQAFAPDGKTITTGGHNTLEVRDTTSGKAIHTIKGRYTATSIALFCPDGKRIATAGDHAAIQFWDPATGKEIPQRPGHQHAVTAGAFSPDGKTLATVSDEPFVRLWDLNSGKARQFAEAKHSVRSMAFLPGNQLAASAAYYWPALWDLSTGRELARLVPKEKDSDLPGGTIAVSADGKTLAVSTGSMRVRLWDTDTRMERPSAFQGQVSDLESPSFDGGTHLRFALASDGKSFAIRNMRNGRGSAILWDIAANKERHKLAERGEPAAFTPDGRLVALLDEQQVILVDAATGAEVRRFKTNAVRAIGAAFSPDGNSIATAGDGGSVQVWEVLTGKQRRDFAGHRGGVRFVAFSPDGRQLASGGEDHTALLWDLTGSAAKGMLTPKDIEVLWTVLADANAESAYQAIWKLAVNADQTLPHLQTRLKPIAPTDPKRLAQLIAALDHERFTERQRATQELGALGELAAPALRAIPPGKESLEYRRRIDEILYRIRTAAPPPEQLRQLRAVEFLEHARTVEAKRVLERLVTGAVEARLTNEAKAAIQRLVLRGVR